MKKIVGKVLWADSGETMEFQDADQYIRTVQEELEYSSTTGFKFQTLSHDPSIRKAIDDIVFALYGMENPSALDEYRPVSHHRFHWSNEEEPEEDEELCR